MNKLNFFKNLLSLHKVLVLFTLCSGMVLLGDLSLLVQQYYAGKKKVSVTVFVHGSVYTVLSMLDAKRVLNDSLREDSPYISLVKNVRKNPLIWQDQIMLQEGWHEFPNMEIESFHKKTQHQDDRSKAAYQFVPAYDVLARQFLPDNVDTKYYLFGHLGLLSQRYRRDIAHELYHALCDEVDRLHKEYWQVQVNIVGHSHAGNIFLNLKDAEEKFKRGLYVDNAVMYGTPIQTETVSYAYYPIFKRVINCYSDGDNVQNNDRFSTKERYSYKRIFHENIVVHCPDAYENTIYDIRLLLNGHSKLIGHTHMWLMGREKKISDVLDPLPIAILTPLLLDLLDNHTEQETHLDCNIIETRESLKLELSNHTDHTAVQTSLDVYDTIIAMRDMVKENWAPADKSRMLLFNYQTGAALWQAIQEWRLK